MEVVICLLCIAAALMGVLALYLQKREEYLRRKWLIERIEEKKAALEELREDGMELSYLNTMAELKALVDVYDRWA